MYRQFRWLAKASFQLGDFLFFLFFLFLILVCHIGGGSAEYVYKLLQEQKGNGGVDVPIAEIQYVYEEIVKCHGQGEECGNEYGYGEYEVKCFDKHYEPLEYHSGAYYPRTGYLKFVALKEKPVYKGCDGAEVFFLFGGILVGCAVGVLIAAVLVLILALVGVVVLLVVVEEVGDTSAVLVTAAVVVIGLILIIVGVGGDGLLFAPTEKLFVFALFFALFSLSLTFLFTFETLLPVYSEYGVQGYLLEKELYEDESNHSR